MTSSQAICWTCGLTYDAHLDGKPPACKEFKNDERNECICAEYDRKGRSTCGIPCAVHPPSDKGSAK